MFARHELGLRGELGLLDRIDANGRVRVLLTRSRC
jgi:hypothetical protein